MGGPPADWRSSLDATFIPQVSPSLWPELALSLLVVAMLSWGCRFH